MLDSGYWLTSSFEISFTDRKLSEWIQKTVFRFYARRESSRPVRGQYTNEKYFRSQAVVELSKQLVRSVFHHYAEVLLASPHEVCDRVAHRFLIRSTKTPSESYGSPARHQPIADGDLGIPSSIMRSHDSCLVPLAAVSSFISDHYIAK